MTKTELNGIIEEMEKWKNGMQRLRVSGMVLCLVSCHKLAHVSNVIMTLLQTFTKL